MFPTLEMKDNFACVCVCVREQPAFDLTGRRSDTGGAGRREEEISGLAEGVYSLRAEIRQPERHEHAPYC